MPELSSTTLSPRQLLTRFQRAMFDLSADDLADLFVVDAIYEFPLFTPGRSARYQGREAIRADFRKVWGASSVRVEAIRNVAVHETTDPQVIIAEQEVAATATTTGRRFVVSSLLVMRVKDGQIVHLRDYSDALGAAHALDRLPALVASLG